MFSNLRYAGIAVTIFALATVAVAGEKTATVSGIVTDEAGKPLSGVRWWISAFEEWRGGKWKIVHRTGRSRKHTTDKNGRFEVTFREEARYDLQFHKGGYAPAFVFQVSSDSPELHVVMNKGVLVTGEVQIKGKNRPDFEGIIVALRLPNDRGLWFKRTTLVDHEGKFRFYVGPPPAPPGAYCKWQLVCAGEVVVLDVQEDTPGDEVVFQISTTSKKKSSTGENEMAAASLEYAKVKAAIQAAYKARSDLLANSTGKGDLTIERDLPSPEAARQLEETGFDPKGFGYGKGGWTVTWYKKGARDRYDVVIPPPKEKDPRGRSYLLRHTNKRAVKDPEKEMGYDILRKEAYVKPPSGGGGNPYGLVDDFCINRLYEFCLHDVPGLLDYHEKEKMQHKLTEEVLGRTRCIKLEFSEDKVEADGGRRRSLFELWVAPEMSYSLVKAQASSNWPGSEELTLMSTYDATYEESSEFPGTRLLKEIRIFDRSGPFAETLTASLRDTKVGVEIPEETFTFEGLGVPKGTKVYDRRFTPPKELEYRGSSFE